MMKKSYLTPILSGVLAVTVVGSGTAYYFGIVKDSDPDNEKDAKNKNSAALTVDQAAANIEEQIDKAQKIAKGEYEGACKAEVSYIPSADVSSTIGTDIKDISVSMEVKQKDKLTGMDYALSYDSKSVISANVVYDNANETAYLKIPELSDAYLTGTIDEISQLMESSSGSGYGEYDVDDFSDSAFEVSAYTADSMSAASAEPDLEALSQIDFEALFKDLGTYADTIKENAPEATDGENKKGEVDGASYELTTKVYTVTAADAQKICQAIADKAKADETLKNSMLSLGLTESDYDAMWDSLVSEIDAEDGDTATIEVYYNGDDLAGWRAYDEESNMQMITYSTDTQLIVDWDITDSNEQVMNAKGVVNVDGGDTLNGTISMDINDAGSTVNAQISYDNLKASEDSMVGGMTISASQDGTEVAKLVYTFNNTADSFDTSVDMTASGINLGTVKITAQETGASDITVPTGTMYKLSDETQLEQYLTTMDAQGWTESLQGILGDELYNMLFGVEYFDDSTSLSDDDYDFEEYEDWEDLDIEDLDSVI